jgi:hypothetical protein
MHKVTALVVFAVACGRGGGSETKAAPEAKPEAKTEARPSGTLAAAAPRKVWPKAVCSILPADAVTAVVGKTVTPREQTNVGICDYQTGTPDAVSVNYYNNSAGNAGEFVIFKGLQAKHPKSHPVAGVGAEAMEGNSGTGAGLAVRLEDDRSFMVEGGKETTRLEVAKLVVARQ